MSPSSSTGRMMHVCDQCSDHRTSDSCLPSGLPVRGRSARRSRTKVGARVRGIRGGRWTGRWCEERAHEESVQVQEREGLGMTSSTRCAQSVRSPPHHTLSVCLPSPLPMCACVCGRWKARVERWRNVALSYGIAGSTSPTFQLQGVCTDAGSQLRSKRETVWT